MDTLLYWYEHIMTVSRARRCYDHLWYLLCHRYLDRTIFEPFLRAMQIINNYDGDDRYRVYLIVMLILVLRVLTCLLYCLGIALLGYDCYCALDYFLWWLSGANTTNYIDPQVHLVPIPPPSEPVSGVAYA